MEESRARYLDIMRPPGAAPLPAPLIALIGLTLQARPATIRAASPVSPIA